MSKFGAKHAIIILFFITIGASLTAFIWLQAVETHVKYKDVVIENVQYDLETNDINIDLLNGRASEVPIAEEGSPEEQTVVTIYPLSGESIGCEFVPLKDLNCEGDSCDSPIKPKEVAQLSLKGNRKRCILEGEKKYHMSIFFGIRAPVSTEFKVG